MTTAATPAIERLPVDQQFAKLATSDQIDRTAVALRAHGFDVRIADTASEAADMALSLVPEGAEIHSGASETLSALRLNETIEESGRF